MHYRDTVWYTSAVMDLNAEIEDLEAQKSQLAGIKSNLRTKTQKNVLLSVKNRLKKRHKWAHKLEMGDLSYFKAYELIRILAELEGRLWSPAECATLGEPRALHEGPGEKAIKMRLGLTLSSSTGRDLPNGEIKWLDNGKGSLQAMQVSLCGQKAWGAFIFEQAEAGLFRGLDPTVRQALKDGEVPKRMIDVLPLNVHRELCMAVLPAKVLAGYGDIYCAFNFGYIVVPADDLNAWRLTGISKGRPRYALNIDYVVIKLLISSSEQQLDVVA